MNKKLFKLTRPIFLLIGITLLIINVGYSNLSRKTKIPCTISSSSQKQVFSFTIPSGWKKMSYEEQKAYNNAYVQSGAQKVKEYSGQSFLPEIKEFYGLESADDNVKILLINMKIPDNSANYIEDIFTESKNKFEWGIKNGQLKKINKNTQTIFKDLKCHYNDFVLSSGMRLINYTMQDDNSVEITYQIGIFIEPNVNYEKYKQDIETILKSIKIN